MVAAIGTLLAVITLGKAPCRNIGDFVYQPRRM
jgi:hypothetical protein